MSPYPRPGQSTAETSVARFGRGGVDEGAGIEPVSASRRCTATRGQACFALTHVPADPGLRIEGDDSLKNADEGAVCFEARAAHGRGRKSAFTVKSFLTPELDFTSARIRPTGMDRFVRATLFCVDNSSIRSRVSGPTVKVDAPSCRTARPPKPVEMVALMGTSIQRLPPSRPVPRGSGSPPSPSHCRAPPGSERRQKDCEGQGQSDESRRCNSLSYIPPSISPPRHRSSAQTRSRGSM